MEGLISSENKLNNRSGAQKLSNKPYKVFSAKLHFHF